MRAQLNELPTAPNQCCCTVLCKIYLYDSPSFMYVHSDKTLMHLTTQILKVTELQLMNF